jgi:hypothetical protein
LITKNGISSRRSYVVKRLLQAVHSRLLRIEAPSSVCRESNTLLSECKQKGQRIDPNPSLETPIKHELTNIIQ